jgi:hypothetical protein
MQVKAIRSFQSSTLGIVESGQTLEAPDYLARQMISAGYLEPYETKVIIQRPTTPAALLSASQAGQALPQTTVSQSESGGKRGRKKKDASLLSTQVSD